MFICIDSPSIRISTRSVMALLLLLCVLLAGISAEDSKEPKCDGIHVRGVFHRSEILAIGLNRPYQLSYYRHKHDIYFSTNVGNDTEDKFEIRCLNLNTSESKPIDEVNNGFATALDKKNGVVYYGGSDGIYRQDLEEEKVKHIIFKYNIWDLFFKDHLYFIAYPSQRLYKYTDIYGIPDKGRHPKHNIVNKIKVTITKKPEEVKWLNEKIFQFAIDGDDDIFITNSTGLYMIKNNTEHRILFHGEKVFRAIAIDNKGEAHFCGQNGIYVPNKHNHTLHEIAQIKNIFGLTFDSEDNIIYSNPKHLVKLMAGDCKEEELPYVPIPIPT